jgi:riboflavin kinase/FMN adenylyltransferase
VSGVVVHGAQVGRKIGFPTANVAPPPLLVPLPDGIYATLATVDGWDTPRHAMTYIGTRPTLNTGERQIETNILDFAGDLYDRVLHTDFIARLRPDSSFPDVESLIEQLGRDEAAAREVLGRLPASS